MVPRLTALQRWGQIQKLRVLNNLRTHVAETPAEGLARSGALAPLRSGARLTPGDSKFLSCHCLHSVCILYVHCHFQCQAVGSSMLMGGKVSPFKLAWAQYVHVLIFTSHHASSLRPDPSPKCPLSSLLSAAFYRPETCCNL